MARKPRASFSVAKLTDEIVFIVDRDDGSLTITNDAEAVAAWCHELYPGRRIIYQDTDDHWDELCHANGVFEGFKPYREPVVL